MGVDSFFVFWTGGEDNMVQYQVTLASSPLPLPLQLNETARVLEAAGQAGRELGKVVEPLVSAVSGTDVYFVRR